MARKFTSAVIFFVVIFISAFTTFSKPSKDIKCGHRISYESDPDDCTVYHVCLGGIKETISRTCLSDFLFHPRHRLCLPQVFFRKIFLKKCEMLKKKKDDAENNLDLPEAEGAVEWHGRGTGDKVHGKNNSLPDQIIMKLPSNFGRVVLKLLRQPRVTENLRVMLSEGGRPLEWEAPDGEEWDIYSDLAHSASMSVVVNRKVNKFRIVYDGTFEFKNVLYSLTPLFKKFMQPLNPSRVSRVVIHGVSYLLSEEDRLSDSYDNAKDVKTRSERIGGEGTKSLMTQLERLINSQLSKRASKRNLGLELFVALDYSIFYKWYVRSSQRSEDARKSDAITNIRFFYTHVINGINDRYTSIVAPDMQFYVRLVGFYIAQTPGDAPFTEASTVKLSYDSINVYKALDNFEEWLEKKSKDPANPLPRYDSAALFTSYQLTVLPSNRNILGLAEIGQTCTLKGASISKDRLVYSTVGTAAHEIGHNLGALHDGQNNNCNGRDNYLMAPVSQAVTNQTFENNFLFSSCSIDYFRNYVYKLDGDDNNCLLNAAYDVDPGLTQYHLATNPGQKYKIDEQCSLLFGLGSKHCAGGGDRDFALCREMRCVTPSTQKCQSTATERALDGTSCGNHKWCQRGVCVYNYEAPATTDNNCIYGDFKGKIAINGVEDFCDAHMRRTPALCYQEWYNDMCCSTCAELADKDKKGCEYGNRQETCQSRTAQDCLLPYWQKHCCEFCEKLEERYKHIQDCKYGNILTDCEVRLNQDKKMCYERRGDCCESCFRRHTGVQGCEYGDKSTQCHFSYACTDPTLKSLCCATCKGVSHTPTTTTTTTNPLCPNGDSATWCATMFKGNCYSYKHHCCTSCSRHFKRSDVGCEYGDRKQGCSSVVRSYEDCQSNNLAYDCCQTCKRFNNPNSNPPQCPNGDEGNFCRNIQTWECYHYKKSCCGTCSQHHNPDAEGCEYGDKVTWCKSYITGSATCNRPEVARLCCKSCSEIKKRNDADDDGPVDLADWCSTIYKGHCYTESVEQTCAATCERHRGDRSGACRYGDLYSWCSSQYCSRHRTECCESCQ